MEQNGAVQGTWDCEGTGREGPDFSKNRVVWYRDRFEVLTHAAAVAPEEGLVLEFGVADGSTILHLAETIRARRIYGFDSFEGLPEPWGCYQAGHFACRPPAVPSNVELVVGMFADTLAPFLDAHPGEAALIHIDCDLYSSTKTVLELLAQRIVAGTVIEMDEYWIEGSEQRAFQEWLTDSGRRCRPEARSVEQLCVVMEA